MRDFFHVAQSLMASTEPAVVLSSLARCCIPAFSDGCSVELSEGVEEVFRVAFPAPDDPSVVVAGSRTADSASHEAAITTLSTSFQAPSCLGYPSYAGVVCHFWTDHGPTEDDAIIAQLMVDRAIGLVRQERLVQTVARAEDRAAKLALDLLASRTEGEAIGILSAKHGLPREDALRLLRRVSRESERKLCDVAAAVVRAGDLDWPSVPWAGGGSCDAQTAPVRSLTRQLSRSRRPRGSGTVVQLSRGA
jgi:ANTAR domain